MRKILILILMAVAASMLVVACADQESETTAASATGTVNGATTPEWLKELIAVMESAPVSKPPGMVVHYEYKGETVYYVPAECCDQLSSLYDAGGNIICSPDGGVDGKGDGRCPDFFDARQGEEVIWQDSRG